MTGRGILAALALFAATPAHAAFDPVEFFHGRSHGTGTLKIIFKSPETVEVDSEGRIETDGLLVVKQVIHEPHKSARTRYWRVRKDGEGRFSGTLSDAVGPVVIEPEGDALRVRYKDKDNLHFDQRLTRTSPREVRNFIKVRRFGVIVATVDEVIRKLD